MSSAQLASDAHDGCSTDPMLQVCLLGRVRLLHYRQPVELTDKAAALLYLLARRNHTGVERDVILAALWPEKDPRLASRSLNTLVWSVRRRLQPFLRSEHLICYSNGVYWLNTKVGIAIDVERFDALVDGGDMQARLGNTEAAAQLYQRAAAVYEGDLHLGTETDADAIIERERLRARLQALLVQLAEWSFERRDISSCMAAVQRVLASDPYREDMHRLLMRCHLALGQRSQALRQYHICMELLNAEYNAEPEPATTELFDQARTSRPTPRHPPERSS